MRWITGPSPRDPSYLDKKKVLEYFERLYDVRGRRVSRQDARNQIDADHSRLLQTLRWLLMPNLPPSKDPKNQDDKVGEYYHSSTGSAQLWFTRFLRKANREAVIPYELSAHMKQRAQRINL